MRRCLVLFAGLACFALAPQASGAQPQPRINDPFERFNRAIFSNSRTFARIAGALARAYRALTPGVIGKGIHNVLENLHEPVVILNDLLQLRVAKAGEAGARTAFNTTLGIGGLIDVAGATGNPQQKNGLADTLGRWGVGPGPYLFLPVLGPSTTRDLFGDVVDAASSPLRWWRYPYDTEVNVTVAGVEGLDVLSENQDSLEALLREAADPYATLRSVYLQNRQGEIDAIRGRAAASEVPAALPDLGAPPPPDTAAPPAQPPAETPPSPDPTPHTTPEPPTDAATPSSPGSPP